MCPVALADDEAAWGEVLIVLCEYEVDLVAFEVAEGVDDAVGRDDGDVFDHQVFEFAGLEDVVV